MGIAKGRVEREEKKVIFNDRGCNMCQGQGYVYVIGLGGVVYFRVRVMCMLQGQGEQCISGLGLYVYYKVRGRKITVVRRKGCRDRQVIVQDIEGIQSDDNNKDQRGNKVRVKWDRKV